VRAAGLRLALQGLWFRRSTALIVMVLATVASAAAVVAPLYARAAEESILRDTLRRADAYTLAVQVEVPQAGAAAGRGEAGQGEFTVGEVERLLAHPAFGAPRLSYTGAGKYAPDAGPWAGGDVLGTVVERDGICDHLPVVEGRCPEAAGEGMLARRSLDLLGARLGDTVRMVVDNSSVGPGVTPPTLALRVVGAYEPVPVEQPYWAGRPYFDAFNPNGTPNGLSVDPPVADPVFSGAGTVRARGVSTYTVDVPLLPDRVGLGDEAVLRDQVRQVSRTATTYGLTPYSRLPAALTRADDGRDLVRIAAPLAVTQLVLLSWWTLYLVVGSATEERSPELGLAKLRGLTARQTRRFSLAEMVLLLLVAAPLGTALGLAAVRGAASRVFAAGTEVVLTWPVLLTVAGALAGGVVTAALASRQVFRRPVSELLRRVPPRARGRGAGVVEVVVAVLAAAGVAQLISDRGGRPSPVALLAPGMIAVAGGLLAARVLVRVARRRTELATARGRPQALVGWAGVGRRPGTARIASVLAVATCLLLVGVQAWTVAERNRSERAAVETGAAVVLEVRSGNPRELLAAVRDADPSGDYAMAAVQVTRSSEQSSVLALDASRADEVLAWGSPSARPKGSVEDDLVPALPASLTVAPGPLSADIEVVEVRSPSPLRLTARLDVGGRWERVDLGVLRPGRRTYAGQVPAACGSGCRLAALAVDHPGTDIESATATLRLHRLRAGDGELDAGFANPDAWRAGTPSVGGPEIQLHPGPALEVTVRAPGGPYAEVVRGDSPEPLPALAGAAATGPSAAEGGVPVGETTGIFGAPTRYRVTRAVGVAPRLGREAVLVDLPLALRLDDDAVVGDSQVWLSRDEPLAERALRQELRAAGITVQARESSATLERTYAGDGAVLALRLLLVCGAAAVVVSVGALLVAAYVGRRQRAYEVAALRTVGLRRRTVRSLLVRENLGTVLVALGCGAVSAGVASWAVLPSLPQFDIPSETFAVRYSPDAVSAWATIGGLAALLVAVGLAVAALQLRTGRADRLREGVR
jgi:hypothetical protein